MGTQKTKPECFVIMPITMPADLKVRYADDEDHFLYIAEHLFKPAIEAAGYTPVLPTAKGSVDIRAGIIKSLVTADLVLCDMSTLNANVFFELGVRTAMNLPTCIVRDEHLPKPPFDVSGINFHTYKPDLRTQFLSKEVPKLTQHILDTLEQTPAKNALWMTYGISAQASEPPDASESQKEAYLEQLIGRVERLMNDRTSQSSIDEGPTLAAQCEMMAERARTFLREARIDASVHAVISGAGAQLIVVPRTPLGDVATRHLNNLAALSGFQLMVAGFAASTS